MTAKSDFTDEQWDVVLEGPTSAGMIVITAQRGGTFRETISMAKAYAHARQQHGQSELLDAIVAAKPELDHSRYPSADDLKEHALARIRDAVALVGAKATAQELDEYKHFIVNLAEEVARAHREGGRDEDPIGDAE